MIYFDNAATTFPKPEQVYKAVDSCLREYCANPGRSGHRMSLKSGRIVLEAREAVAKLFNIQKLERIIFTANATDSINLALKGFLKKGDHVITTSMEHNSILRPLKVLEKLGVEVTIVACDENGELLLSDIEKEIKPNTSLIITTHASNVTGTIMPIKQIGQIAHKFGIAYMLDSAQTAGIHKIDVEEMNIDLLAFTGHKGLYGIQGVGGLYIGDSIELVSIKEGGTGSFSESLLQPDIMPDKFESGTLNLPGIAGLLAGIDFIQKTGIETIRNHEIELGQNFLEKLRNIDKIRIYGPQNMDKQTAVFSINIGRLGSSEVSYLLDDSFDIATRSGLHCAPLAHETIGTMQQGTVRLSFGYFNTKEQVEAAIYALRKIAESI